MAKTTYAENYKGFGKQKNTGSHWTNPDRCDCGGPANVHPYLHYGAGYLLKELTIPKRGYCVDCYYKLVDQDHKERTRLNPGVKVSVTTLIAKIAKGKTMEEIPF